MKYWIGVLALASAIVLKGQVISGRVYDAFSKEPLAGASVQVLSSETGVISDSEGSFEIVGIDPGRYSLKISFVGYRVSVLSDVWVKTGKETVREVSLQRSYQDLEEVTVTEQVSFAPPGKIRITEEQINRFAATYYDPARLITSSPDVAVANDQNNLISVRGIPPSYNTWNLEGAEIVNPNHLSNAGTFLDQPTPNGGGVNILSAQMLSQSNFLYSTFGNSYGNSVGGMFDMKLKNGNTKEQQYTAQASLIGLDMFAEGPYKQGGKATFAANYRYSFTGILTGMGVDFGGESIGFQDLSLVTTVPVGKRTNLKVFGVGGLSFNHFDHQDFAESEREKDRSDIYYDNKMGAAGAKLISSFRNSQLTNTFVASGYENERDQTAYNNQDNYQNRFFYGDRFSIYSGTSQWETRMKNTRLTLGTAVNYYAFRLDEETYFTSSLPASRNRLERNQILGRHYINASSQFGERILLDYGLTYNWTSNQNSSWDPRAKITFIASPSSAFSFGAGRYSQLYQPYNVYFAGPESNQATVSNERNFIKSNRFSISYEYTVDQFNVGLELFHYYFPEVYLLFNSTSARTTGVSVVAEKAFNDGFYFRGGFSIFDAPLESEFKNRYNTNYNVSLAAGKEWNKQTKKKSSAFGVNGRLMYQGGQYLTPQSWWAPDTYRTNDYFRFDIRIQWVRYREKYTRVLAIDLQNVLNTQNQAYKYFDSFTGEEEMQYQLGLIPILTYRIEW